MTSETTTPTEAWHSLYPPSLPPHIEPEFVSILDMIEASIRRVPDRPAIRYFGRSITYAELDRMSDALASGLLALGFAAGDRAVLYLQNVPQFVIAQIAVWKAGGIAVSANPMYKARELAEILHDSGATVLVSLESLYRDVAAAVVRGTAVRTVVTTSELDLAADESPLLTGVVRTRAEGTHDLLELVDEHDGERPVRPALQSSDVAFLTYTSGTTGPPKGAMTTHGNAVFNAQTFRDWIGLNGDDVVLGVAPLFHITGLIAHIAVSLLLGAPLVLTYRFDVSDLLRTVRDEQVTFTVGSITVFIALMNAADADSDALTSLRAIYSGGAPIAPATARAFQQRFGIYLHNIYGLTETTSPAIGVPFGVEAPVDPASGALAVGIPVFDTTVRILDEAGTPCAPGTIGEIAVSGPQVCAGYWRKPAETAEAFVAGELRTGDVGFMDEHGWFYLVDRKKDQINAGGYKVWPREVEDVLYEHPAVREAAVVGVSDDYRGETVKAYVSLVPGADATAQELIAFARERMAAYKYPRLVELVDDIPKTTSGKLLRRALRDPT